MRTRSLLSFAFVAAIAACTTFDNLKPDDGDVIGGAGPGIACPNPPCVIAPDGTVLGGGKGAGCKVGTDCASTVCQDGACTEAQSTDGVKNGTETDVDCGGTAPTNAPKCVAAKACKIDDDCLWGKCNGGACGDDVKGVKDGDQTDIDCGGALSPACDWRQGCQFDRDCGPMGHCGTDKKCLIAPSCDTVHGGTTCGTGEFADADKSHETCCQTLLVQGFSDPKNPGKLVYVDKYEITAGRMRKFLDTLQKTDPDGNPNVKAYITAHKPARWNDDWTTMLPEGWEQGEGTYTVANPTTNLAYPGMDQEAANPPVLDGFLINSGPQTIETGLYFELGSPHLFPEFKSDPAKWPQGDDYAAGHNLNCTNEAGSFGFGTFWFPDDVVAQFSGGVKKGFTKDEMDEKALNCTPFGLFAAFCAWDGGQLMTDEVFDAIAGGAWPENPAKILNPGGSPAQYPDPPPRLAGANTTCGPDGNSLNVGGDTTQTCDGVYSFPDPARGGDFDASSRVAPPGRIPADVVAINTGDEPWHDLKGNLNEAVFRSDGRFTFRGYGMGWSSISAHRTQETTPRMKEGSFGARCMRFRDTPAPKTK